MDIKIKDLSQPFDNIKQRKGNFGQTLDYIETNSVIQRLNDVLEGNWSFEIVEFKIGEEEVFVKGQLTVGNIVKQQFGGSQITRKKDSKEIICISDDLKSAASDCLKKCATLFGVGLSLYSNGHKPNTSSNRNGYQPNSNGRITNAQITELFSTCKSNGIPQSQVIKAAKDIYHKSISNLTGIESRNLIEQLTKRTANATN